SEVFDLHAWPGVASPAHALSLELPDGSRTTGGRAVRPGDTLAAPPRLVIGDGARLWTLAGRSFRELDPSSGRLGPASLPAFLAGARTRRARDGRFAIEGVDGRRLSARLPAAPVAL